ncbi:MAG: 16S rRNA (uracil(1498)-N(3))-methyltransferase [Candidatus Chromulinivorax sp.]
MNSKQSNSSATKSNHEFALYLHDFSKIQSQPYAITITDENLVHRLKNVLRLKIDDHCVLFDRKSHAKFRVHRFEGKNKVVGLLYESKQNLALHPEITFILPLLKMDALSDAVYSLSEVGITKIQLVTTQKTQTPYSAHLLEKLERVAIAAAEQSKMFAYPQILPAIKFTDWLSKFQGDLQESENYYFDVSGVDVTLWYQKPQIDKKYQLLVGPEGDLTQEEKELARSAGFQFCALTPTILRSVRAISLISGLFRL